MTFEMGRHVLLQRWQADLFAERVHPFRFDKWPAQPGFAVIDPDVCTEDLALIFHRLHSVRDETKVPGISLSRANSFAQQLDASASKVLLGVGVLEQEPS